MLRDGAVPTDYRNKKSKVIKNKFMIYNFNKKISKDKKFVDFLNKYIFLSKSFEDKKNEIRYYLTNYFINHQLEKKKSFKIKDKLRF